MALKSYTDIASVTLTPMVFNPGMFTGALHALGDRPFLSRLTVNHCCMEGPNAHLLVKIGGLRELELINPTQTILDLLPEWLGRLSKSLVALHLTVNFKPFNITTWSLTLVLGRLLSCHASRLEIALAACTTSPSPFSWLWIRAHRR
jgi:hypothetical protein